MEGKILEESWVYRHSSLLMRMSQFWMILTPKALLTYKKKEDKTPSIKIPTSEIQSIERKPCNQSKRMFAFSVTSRKSTYLFYVEDKKKQEGWLSSIYSQMKNQQFPRTQIFADMKLALLARERELLQRNDEIFAEQRTAVQSQKSVLDSNYDSLIAQLSALEATEVLPIHSRIKEIHSTSSKANAQEKLADAPGEVRAFFNHHNLERIIAPVSHFSVVNPSERTLYRSETTRALKWKYASNKIDALSFTVSSDITLTGLSFCTPYKPTGKLVVKQLLILNGRSTNSKPLYVHSDFPSLEYNHLSSIQKVKLDSPLQLKRRQVYTVVAMLDGDSSFKCVDCRPRIEVDSVMWEFSDTTFTKGFRSNKTDVLCGPIASFHFQKP